MIQPVLDGEVTNYYEWLAAGYFDITRARGAMHQIETLLREIYYGFSMCDLYIRMGVNFNLSPEEMRKLSFAIITSAPAERKAEVYFDPADNRYRFKFYRAADGHDFEYVKELESFGVRRIIELGIPFSDLEAKPSQRIEFVVVVYKDGQELERWPRGGGISVTVPTESYLEEQWYV